MKYIELTPEVDKVFGVICDAALKQLGLAAYESVEMLKNSIKENFGECPPKLSKEIPISPK